MSNANRPPQHVRSTTAGHTDAVAKVHREPIDAAAIMKVKHLHLRARIVVEGFFNGLHRSPFHGFSAEFSEYRQYAAGDDTRFVDWRLYARSDRYYIKRFEDETNRRCYLVVDQSRSMTYGTVGYTKAEYAATLAATFAYYLTLQRDCVGLLTFDEAIRDFLPARHRPGHLKRLWGMLDRPATGQSTQIGSALEEIASLVKKRGLIVLVSDFLAPMESLAKPLGYLRSRGHEVVAMRLLDPREVDLDFDEAAIFRDLESGQPLFVEPDVARGDYQLKFERHRRELSDVCTSLGIGLHTFLTNEPFDAALYQWLVQQVRQPGSGAGFRRGSAGAR